MDKLFPAAHGLAGLLYPYAFSLVVAFGVIYGLVRLSLPAHWDRLITLASSIFLKWTVIAFGLCIYLCIGYLVLTFPGYVDPGEPMIVSGSYFVFHGRAVYDLVTPYGPYLYLPYGASLLLFGANIVSLKLLVLAGNAILLSLLFYVYRKYLSISSSLLVIAVVLSASLMKQDYLFQIRGDIFIYVAVALSLVAIVLRSAWAATVVLIAALTLGCGIKITAVLYLLYPVTIFYRRHGPKHLFMAGLGAGVLSLVPFTVTAISLPDFIHWLHLMSRQSRSHKELFGNIVTTVLLLLPISLLMWRFWQIANKRLRHYLRCNSLQLSVLVVTIVVIDLLGGKVGAGRHHLIPFFLVVSYLAIDLNTATDVPHAAEVRPSFARSYLWGCFGILLILASASELRDTLSIVRLERPQATALTQDLRSLMTLYPHKQMELGDGFGEFNLDTVYSPMYAAPELVFAGNPYTFEPSSEADREMAGSPTTEAQLNHIRKCETDVWLIPKGNAPFKTKSIYSGMYPDLYTTHWLFPQSLQSIFAESYRKSSSSNFFDIYTCRASRFQVSTEN